MQYTQLQLWHHLFHCTRIEREKMAKMASLHAEGYTDADLEQLEIAEILEDILID